MSFYTIITNLMLAGLTGLLTLTLKNDLNHSATLFFYDAINDGMVIAAYCFLVYTINKDVNDWKNDKPRRQLRKRSTNSYKEMLQIS